MAPPLSSWLQGFRAVSAPLRSLVCFPYAGAGAAVFRDWASAVGSDTELLAVRLPGRESTRRCIGSRTPCLPCWPRWNRWATGR
nr:thioesterase domain-containing protein [Azospirillum brasilense]